MKHPGAPGLAEKLQVELAGILAWAVQGASNWQVVGPVHPEVVQMATEAPFPPTGGGSITASG